MRVSRISLWGAHRVVRIVSLGLVSAFLALSGCSGDPQPKLAEQCFPSDAYRWMAKKVAAEEGGQAAPRIKTSASKATIYIDRSGSMVGYLAGATNLERPLQDLVTTLPATLGLAELNSDVRSFGTAISDPLPNFGAELESAEGFRCKPDNPASCDNKETHLDVVLRRIKDNPDELAVLISDLWFTNSQIQSSGIAELQPLLTEILQSGRVISIYGINAPFDGTIYDLPKRGSGLVSTDYQGRHPLFMMVIGEKPDVQNFGELLPKSGSRFIAEGMDAGAIQHSLFAVDPGPENSQEAQPLSSWTHPGVSRDSFAIPLGVTVQRFALEATLPDLNADPDAAEVKVPSWLGPKETSFLDDAVWRGETVSRTRIWEQFDSECTETSWAESGASNLGWSKGARGQQRFGFDPDEFAAALPREGTYIVVGEIQRSALEQPNPQTEWMRGEWSLDPVRAERMVGLRPAVFPTLNLSEFGRIMEGALAEAARRKNQPIAGFAFMVRVKD